MIDVALEKDLYENISRTNFFKKSFGHIELFDHII